MRHGISSLVTFTLATFAGGSACAMTGSAVERPSCTVLGGDKLPVEVGGPAGICNAVSEALAKEANGIAVIVRVQVLSNSRLKADIERDGIALPAQNFAVSDRQLSKGSVERFARAIAQAVVKADQIQG
jgi:hypothetical protein